LISVDSSIVRAFPLPPEPFPEPILTPSRHFRWLQDPESVLDRLEVRPVFDLASFEHQVLDSLKTRFDSDIVDADGELLMVVDPVTALYGPGLSSNALQSQFLEIAGERRNWRLTFGFSFSQQPRRQ
jgi:hypothetical protein